MTFKLSRDPALYLSLFAMAVKLFSAFVLHVSGDTQTLVNAFAAAIAAVIVAFAVQHDGQVAALLGAAQALLALVVGFGLHVSTDNQALIMSFLGLVAAAFVRTQVTARTGPVLTRGLR